MPFIADWDGDTVLPEEIDTGLDVMCWDCGGVMRVRDPDGRARHFYHIGTAGGGAGGAGSECGGGESDPHRKMKSVAVSALREAYSGEYAMCAPVVAVDVSGTTTAMDQRRADALLRFEERNRFYGDGIIVEVQYRNAEKDVQATTHDYLTQDYSVYWATPEDFSGDWFDLDAMEAAFQDVESSAAFAVYRDEPPSLDAPRSAVPGGEDNSSYATTDPVPDCDHIRVSPSGDVYQECVRCGLEFERCLYDEQHSYLRRAELVSGSYEDRVLAADTRSVEQPVSFRTVETRGAPPDHQHRWKRLTKIFEQQKYVCRDCDSTMVVGADHVVVEHRLDSSWTPPAGVETGDASCDVGGTRVYSGLYRVWCRGEAVGRIVAGHGS